MAHEEVLIGALVIVAGILSIEFGISVAIFEIVAGILGGNVLGLQSVPWLDYMAHLGLLGLMFYAGFETDMEVLARNWKRSFLIGGAAFFTPFLVIIGLGMFFLQLSIQSTLLLAIALSTTSLAIVYPVLKECGLLDKEVGQLLLSSAMVVDLLSMFILTVCFEGLGWVAFIFLLLVFPAMWVLPRLGRLLFSRYGQNIVEYEVRFLLLVILVLGFSSEAVGIHAAIIAYLAGLFWNELFLEDEKVIVKLQGIVFGFFAPVFFFSAGMLFKFETLTMRLLWLVPLLGVLAIGAKYIGTRLASQFVPLIRPYAHYAAMLFNFRLTFGIVAALIGLEAGFITSELYTAVLMVILGSALFSSFSKVISKTDSGTAKVPGS